jgi:hypothetical protein
VRAAAKTQQTLREPRRRTHARKETHKHGALRTSRAHSAARAASVERRALPPHAEARRRHEVDVCSAHKKRGKPGRVASGGEKPGDGLPPCQPSTVVRRAAIVQAVPAQRGSRGGRSRCGSGGIGRTEVYDLDGGRDTCQRVRPSHLSVQQATQHATAKKQTNK